VRLINYGCGEITDRLSILSLKILHGAEAGKEIGHFEQERNALLTKLAGRTLNGSWFEQALALGAVNAALWQAEDDLRGWRAQSTGGVAIAQAIVDLACRIQALNDRRADLIGQINARTGEKQGAEKL